MLKAADFAFMKKQLDVAAPLAEESITYKRFTVYRAGDPVAGIPPSPEFDNAPGTVISAIVNPVNEAAADEPGGRVTIGAVVFMIRVSVLPLASWDGTTALDGADDGVTPPNENDRIMWKSATYKPLRVSTARNGGALFWVVRCDRL